MKIISVDYGTKKIGLAISDELCMVSEKLPVIKTSKVNDQLALLTFIVMTQKPDEIVFGIPYGPKGNITQQAQIVLDFIEQFKERISLTNPDAKIVTWDETYTSKRAEKGKSKKYKHNKSDSEAARLFLQQYLDWRGENSTD